MSSFSSRARSRCLSSSAMPSWYADPSIPPAWAARLQAMRIPTDAEILALHAKYAPTPAALDLVYGHCVIVRGIAEQLLARVDDIDGDLVRAGALLHDNGVYRLYDDAGELDHADYIRHGVLGHELLAEEGLPERICRFASH